MELYLYAVVDGLPALPRARGVTPGPLRQVKAGRLLVVAGAVPGGFVPAASLASLKAHDRVVRRLWSSARAVVPFRFGAVVESQAELRRLLRPGQEPLRQALALARGRAQMALRLLTVGGRARRLPEPVPDEKSSGASYLRGRLQRERWLREVPELAEVCAAVAPWVRARKARRADGRGPLLATVFHLVDRSDVRAYRRAVRSTVPLPQGYRLVVTGPSPAWAFAPEGPL